MRIKKIKYAKEKIEASNYLILDAQNYKDNWSGVFKNNNKIRIEIGCGKGNFITEMARLNPDINFIGIEMFDSVLLRAIEKQEELKLPNLRFVRINALYLSDIFGKEIDTIYLNFSDPWPKKRHHKRRLTSAQFLEVYDKVFISDCKIVQKTDNEELFIYSIESLSHYGYKLSNITFDLHNSKFNDDNIQTEYEMKFSLLNKKIFKLEAYKK